MRAKLTPRSLLHSSTGALEQGCAGPRCFLKATLRTNVAPVDHLALHVEVICVHLVSVHYTMQRKVITHSTPPIQSRKISSGAGLQRERYRVWRITVSSTQQLQYWKQQHSARRGYVASYMTPVNTQGQAKDPVKTGSESLTARVASLPTSIRHRLLANAVSHGTMLLCILQFDLRERRICRECQKHSYLASSLSETQTGDSPLDCQQWRYFCTRLLSNHANQASTSASMIQVT